MAQKRKTRPAGDKADKPGTDALRQLLTYFAHDEVPILTTKATVGQEGTEAAQAALKYLAAGNAEQAVRAAIDAMLVYVCIENRNVRLECGDDTRRTAEWWAQRYKDIEPAAVREIGRRNAQTRKHRVAPDTVDRANELMAKYHSQRPRPKKTSAAKMAAAKMTADGRKVSYKTIIKHLPSWLKEWNG
jgi:hypothetical protein